MLKPFRPIVIVFAAFGLVACLTPVSTKADEQSRRQVIEGLAELLSLSDDGFEQRARELLGADDFQARLSSVQDIQRQTKNAAAVDVNITSESTGQIIFGFSDRDVVVDFQLSDEPHHQIVKLESTIVKQDAIEARPITWATVNDELDRAAENDFAGAILLSRDGRIVLNKGYGFANREKEIKNTRDTVFAIGSAPIDFTHAGILLLKDQNKLTLDDPITKYFDNVPADKEAITIEHLMTGRSGLRDFHELPSDENPDHSWIDRDEAVRRIMRQRLLFVPGTQRQHSHSAWGLLAAIIEAVSGESYPDFTKKRLFEPAGMRDTGFFGDPIPEHRVAVGYGSRSSDPNSPPHWGRTSWLVMGSGGQVSTLGDMYRWEKAMRSGSILSAESSAAYLGDGDGVSQDGDSFGFEFMHSKNPDRLFMIISNAVNTRADRRSFDRLGGRLHRLIKSTPSDE